MLSLQENLWCSIVALGLCILRVVSCLLQLIFLQSGFYDWVLYSMYSHGEALTFEPLLMEDREQSPLRDLYIVAIATVTQVNLSQLSIFSTTMCLACTWYTLQVLILKLNPPLKGLTSLPLRVGARLFKYFFLHFNHLPCAHHSTG